VDVVDMSATRATPSAYGSSVSRRVPPPATIYQSTKAGTIPQLRGGTDWQRTLGCLLRLVIVGLFLFVAASLLGISFLLFQYYRIGYLTQWMIYAKSPRPRILDRNGNTL
jgi:hypothetical protein